MPITKKNKLNPKNNPNQTSKLDIEIRDLRDRIQSLEREQWEAEK